MYDLKLECPAHVEVPGGYFEKTICLPIVPFPGLAVGALVVADVFVCQGGEKDRTVSIRFEPQPESMVDTIEGWGGWEFVSCE